MTLSASRFAKRHQLCHASSSGITTMAESDFSKHDQWSQLSLGQIIGRWHAWIVKKNQPLALMPEQSVRSVTAFS